GVRRVARRERTRARQRVLHQGEPALPRRLPGEARAQERPLVLPGLGRGLRRGPRRALPPAREPSRQEALPWSALGCRGDRRAREPRPAHLLRRALPRARRRRAAALL